MSIRTFAAQVAEQAWLGLNQPPDAAAWYLLPTY